jgi:hypothetical protein
MDKNKLSFDSESFQLHYLTLNLQLNNFKRIKKLADYLSKTFDCNSVFIDCKDSTKNCPLIKNKRSLCQAEFRVNSQKYWSGTTLRFSESQSTYLYKIIKNTRVDLD